MKAKSGGGIQSSVNKKVGVRTGGSRSTNVVSPRGVSQLGYAAGSEIKEQGSYGTKNSALSVFERKAPEQTLGNAKALDVKGGGSGTGRTVMRSGSQGTHGPVVAGSTPAPRDILSEFGPESKR